MTRYALYARTSSEKQELQETIQTQLEIDLRYAQQNRFKIELKYLDDGVTSHIPFEKRPEGTRLIKDARAGIFTHLIVSDFTRLGRTALDVLQICDQLEVLGITIISVREPMPLGAGQSIGTLLRTVLSGFAQYGRDTIRLNAIAGHERAVREGRWNGGPPPFGYRVENHRLVIYEEQAAIVRMIFERYAEGDMSLPKLAAYLNAHNVLPMRAWAGHKRASSKWRTSSVYKILCNTTYIGKAVWRKSSNQRDASGILTRKRNDADVRISFSVPSVVSEDLFGKVTAQLRQGVQQSMRNTKRRVYVLRGLLICGRCGLSYTGGVSPTTTAYYKCRSISNGDGSCGNRYVRGVESEEAAWQECLRRLSNPEQEKAELLKDYEQLRAVYSVSEQTVSVLTKEIAAKAQERSRIISLVRRGTITEDEAARELDQLQHEADLLETERIALETSLSTLQNAATRVASIEGVFAKLRSQAELANDPEQRRAIIREVISRITVIPLDGKSNYHLIFKGAA